MRHNLYERIGRFVILKADLDALPDWLQQIMARVIVMKAEFTHMEDGVEYFALSPEFDKTEGHMVAWTYRPIIEDGRFLRWSR